MNFKEMIEKDIKNTFLNLSEFATTHQFNGKAIQCVVDEEKFQNKLKNGFISQEGGVFEEGFTLFVSEKDFKLKPHPGEELTLDGTTYTVILSKFDMGLHEIDLVRYEEI